MDKVNKTNVINTIEMSSLPKSYKWDNARSTFPSRWWVDILVEFFQHQNKKKEIQKKYKSYLPNSNLTKKDNEMHINVLLKKLLISNTQNFELLKKWSINKLEKEIINHINKVIKNMKNFNKMPKNWQKQISNWEEYVKYANDELPIENKTSEEIEKFINKTLKEQKIRLIDYKFCKNIKKIINEENEINEFRRQQIGKIGETITRNLLIIKYGLENVTHTSEIDKYSPYDFKIAINKKTFYIEVKSSSKLSPINWYISRREMEFYKTHKKQYSIIFVKDVTIQKDSTAIVEEIKNPNIIIDNKLFGLDNGTLIVSPISYKGLY